ELPLNSDEVKILDSLRLWRNEKAKQQNLPSYFIATNKELLSIAKYKPAKKEELSDIKGFGRHKIENYGMEIIGLLENIYKNTSLYFEALAEHVFVKAFFISIFAKVQ